VDVRFCASNAESALEMLIRYVVACVLQMLPSILRCLVLSRTRILHSNDFGQFQLHLPTLPMDFPGDQGLAIPLSGKFKTDFSASAQDMKNTINKKIQYSLL